MESTDMTVRPKVDMGLAATLHDVLKSIPEGQAASRNWVMARMGLDPETTGGRTAFHDAKTALNLILGATGAGYVPSAFGFKSELNEGRCYMLDSTFDAPSAMFNTATRVGTHVTRMQVELARFTAFNEGTDARTKHGREARKLVKAVTRMAEDVGDFQMEATAVGTPSSTPAPAVDEIITTKGVIPFVATKTGERYGA